MVAIQSLSPNDDRVFTKYNATIYTNGQLNWSYKYKVLIEPIQRHWLVKIVKV